MVRPEAAGGAAEHCETRAYRQQQAFVDALGHLTWCRNPGSGTSLLLVGNPSGDNTFDERLDSPDR